MDKGKSKRIMVKYERLQVDIRELGLKEKGY
jgi:hypothetical protein